MFVRTPYATAIPDLQLHVLPWGYPGPNQDAPVRHQPDPRQALTIMSTLIYPKSRGTVRLTSADPAAAPAIDPNYLDEQADIDVLVSGMEIIREAMAAREISSGVHTEVEPGAQHATRADLAKEVLRPRHDRLPPRRHVSYGHRRSARSSTRSSVCSASKGCASRTRRSCRASSAATPTPPSMMIGEHAAAMIIADR